MGDPREDLIRLAGFRDGIEAAARWCDTSADIEDPAYRSAYECAARHIRALAPSPRSEAESGPVVREDWRCEAGTTSCPGTQGSLAKDWICTACGRKAHAPVTWRDKGLTAKPKTYEPDAPVPAESATKGEEDGR